MRILLVEDEPEMARLIASLVEATGVAVDHVGSLTDAKEATARRAYDLLLLDRRLPDGDGASLLPALRATRPGARVMLLTAMDALNDKISGLEAGADDYLTKPFQGEELVARIRACLRRPAGETLPPLRVGALSLDFASRDVTVNGQFVAFNRRELMLLQALMRRVSRVTTREALLEDVYGLADDVQANTLDTLVSRLRRRLVELEAGVELHTVRGVGYMLTEQAA